MSSSQVLYGILVPSSTNREAFASEIIKADYSVECSDFLGTRLALLDEIIEASIRSKQHSNAVAALKLQAQLTRLLEGS